MSEIDELSVALSDKKKRVQIDFSAKAFLDLKRLQIVSGCQSIADTIRNGVRLYMWWLEMGRQGYEICVRKGDQLAKVELIFKR